MRIALDQFNNRVVAEETTKEGRYTCPICGEAVRPRAIHSQQRCPHFAHLPNCICPDNWTSDMSEWHLSWQQKFPMECREVVLEKDGVKHRADILIKDRVIEFQHSQILAKEFRARNEFYQSCGKRVIWVFDITNEFVSVRSEPPTDACVSWYSRPAFLRDYNMDSGYSLFLQKGDRLFWVFYEKNNVFHYFEPGFEITSEMFLKDFGCASQKNTHSITAVWNKHKERLLPNMQPKQIDRKTPQTARIQPKRSGRFVPAIPSPEIEIKFKR